MTQKQDGGPGQRANAQLQLSQDQLRLVAVSFLGHMWHDYRKRIAQAHGWEPKKTKDRYHTDVDWQAPIRAHIAGAGKDELARFLMELVLTGDEGGYRSSGRDELQDAVRRYKVNVKAIERQVAAEAKARAEKRKRKSKPRVQTSANTKGANRGDGRA